MSSMVEDRIQVGTSDKGNVFIFHFAEKGDYTDALENHRFEVRVGNHTILTTINRAAAESVANALCGITPPAPEPVKETVSKK